MSYLLMDRVWKQAPMKASERLVLANLAWRANRFSSLSWPSVDLISADTGISERQVYRDLNALKAKGLIVPVGVTKYGTVEYLVLPDGCEGGGTDHAALAGCHGGSSDVPPSHPNKVTEQGNGTEQSHTSPQNPGLIQAPDEKAKSEAGQSQGNKPCEKEPPATAKVAGVSQNSSDSKVVTAWKVAHANAGLSCLVTPTVGYKLARISKGSPAIAYGDVLNTLIPVAVAEWGDMCKYLAGHFGVFLWGKKPLPTQPSAGFLLRFKKQALDYCSQDKEMRIWWSKQYADVGAKVTKEPANPYEYE